MNIERSPNALASCSRSMSPWGSLPYHANSFMRLRRLTWDQAKRPSLKDGVSE